MEHKQNIVVFLTFNNFPNQDAGSVRLIALAKGLVSSGYYIKVISMAKKIMSDWETVEPGIDHFSVRANGGRIRSAKSYLFFNSSVNRLLSQMSGIKAIFVCNTMFYVLQNRQLKKLKVPLIYDSTEWYIAKEFRQGILSLEYISNSIIVNGLGKPWKVIAISQYLENKYKRKNLKVIRVPAIIDLASMSKDLDDYILNKKIQIIYAGSPGKKDALGIILQGLSMTPENVKNNIEMKIIGISREQYQKINKNNFIPSNVSFMGSIPREQVIEELQRADFSTFIRDNNLRFVKAGFPSKLVESMSLGIPVITNLTSDLHLYLENGINSVIVADFTVDAYTKALAIAVNMNKTDLADLHLCARKTA